MRLFKLHANHAARQESVEKESSKESFVFVVRELNDHIERFYSERCAKYNLPVLIVDCINFLEQALSGFLHQFSQS